MLCSYPRNSALPISRDRWGTSRRNSLAPLVLGVRALGLVLAAEGELGLRKRKASGWGSWEIQVLAPLRWVA